MMSMPRFSLGLALLAASLALSGCQSAHLAPSKPERRYIEPRSNADQPPGYAFSGAVQVGDTLYLSGQIGLQPDGKVPADAAKEAKLVLDEMERVLGKAGMTMDDLVQVQVMCSDLSLYGVFNAEYKTRFRREFPARAFIGGSEMLFGARFEVIGIAVKR